ncbi:MAG: type II toxin-antitoxin system VapC family toxin [Burkholderiaceae bacterium]|jgi:predicted nucleic-acid-binding protein|nr:type II toxin-antitoxin system VapC family toxin [Burkholderiaceae bacterium]
MIGLDTNVLVRYLAQDDKAQSARATRFIETSLSERSPGFISLVVLVEVCWVLQSLYQATTSELVDMVADLLATPQFELQARQAVQDTVAALRAEKPGKASFTDFLIARIALREGCRTTVSFDRAAIRYAGMTAVE